MTPSVAQIASLGAADPTVAPLARLQAHALQAADAPGWAAGLPPFDPSQLGLGQPLLHGRVVGVDAPRLARLLRELLAQRGAPAERLDALAVVAAAIAQDADRLRALAEGAGIDPPLLGVVGQTAALPLLLACDAPSLDTSAWTRGCCPVCAAWPALAEMRGLERVQWLRCGRCAAQWRFPPMQCVFCGNADERSHRYLAAEGARESRRVALCDGCGGALKSVATLGPLTPADLLLMDLTTLELDAAALDEGFGRPAERALALELRLEPLPAARRAWPWQR